MARSSGNEPSTDGSKDDKNGLWILTPKQVSYLDRAILLLLGLSFVWFIGGKMGGL